MSEPQTQTSSAVGRDLAASKDPDGPLFGRAAEPKAAVRRETGMTRTPPARPPETMPETFPPPAGAKPENGNGKAKPKATGRPREDKCRRLTDGEIMTMVREASGLQQKDLAKLTEHSTFVFYAIERGRRVRTDTQREVWERLGRKIGRFTRGWEKGREQGDQEGYERGFAKGRIRGQADVYNACQKSKLDPNYRISPAVQAEIREHVRHANLACKAYDTGLHNRTIADLADAVAAGFAPVWWKPWTWARRRMVDAIVDRIEDQAWRTCRDTHEPHGADGQGDRQAARKEGG